jgi:hypothetical protein
MGRKQSIESIARELQDLANQHPVSALTPIHPRHRRDITHGSCDFRIQFRKEEMPGFGWIYHLSIGHPTGRPTRVPKELVKRIRGAFFGEDGGVEMPSTLGNTYQFIQETE